MINQELEAFNSLKASYFNILASFLESPTLETRYVKILLKWGLQLQLHPQDLLSSRSLEELSFKQPLDKVSRLEAIFHLVHMIYLDQTVEDLELEIAGIYSERLGFKKEIVTELFKSIATKDFDIDTPYNVRTEVLDFLILHDDL
jgi:hypothetical protein